MRRVLLVFLSVLAIAAPRSEAQAVPAADDPPWFKHLHVLAGMAVGLSAAEIAAGLPPAQGDQVSPLLLAGVAVTTAALAGVGKELLDSTGFGDPRFSDVVVTTVGGMAAAGIAVYAQSLYPRTAAGRQNDALFVLSTAALLAIPVVIGMIQEIAGYFERLRGASAAGDAFPRAP